MDLGSMMHDFSIVGEDDHAAAPPLAEQLSGKALEYLGEGASCVAFVDTSRQVVVKLLKSPEGLLRQCQEWGFDPAEAGWPTSVPGDSVLSAKRKLEQDFEQAKVALQLLPNETATLYINARPHEQRIDVDLDGSTVNLSTLPFIVQHRVDPCGVVLAEALAKDERERARQVVLAVSSFIVSLWGRGWADASMYFHHNLGIDRSGRVVAIDTCDLIDPTQPLDCRKDKATKYASVSARWLHDVDEELGELLAANLRAGLQNFNAESYS